MKKVLDRRVRRTRQEDLAHSEDVSEVFRRLGAAEGQISQLREQFVGFSTQLKHQDQQLNTIEEQLGSIANSFQQRNQTDWKTLAAWASVILAVVALYTNLNLSPIKDSLAEARVDRNDLRAEVRGLSASQSKSIDQLVAAAEARGRALQRLDELDHRTRGLQ